MEGTGEAIVVGVIVGSAGAVVGGALLHDDKPGSRRQVSETTRMDWSRVQSSLRAFMALPFLQVDVDINLP